MNFSSICSMWYANLGAVELSKVQLEGFPDRGWQGPAIAPRLDPAESALLTALAFDPVNRTANHRLGLIATFRRDFSSAAAYLAAAHAEAPAHRGIIKSLGFSYAWLGDMDNAVSFLKEIPETEKELDAYYSWWKEQGRDDLSERVVQVYQALESVQVQP
jgi:lipopolysaccharide biosynthesis regulator YciM